MSLFIIGTKFFKISVNLRCDLCMKKQLDQLTAYTPGLSPESLKKQYGIKGELHKLASNENVYGPSPKVKTAIQSHFLFGAGLDEVILMISRAVLSPGDKIITSESTFGQYYHNAIVESADVIQVPLKDGGFDLDGMLQQIDNKTSLIWLCNPNNPTGTYFSHDELFNFLKRVPSGIPVLIDEAYVEFVTADDFPDTLKLQEDFDNAFLLRTFSKAYGLAGLRVGYVIASEDAIEKWNIIRPPFNVTRISEYAAIAALEDQEYLKEVTQKNSFERDKFYQIPQSQHFLPSQANFVFVKTSRSQALYDALLNVGCITRLFPNGVRITIGLPEQNNKMIEVLKHFEY